MEDLLIAENARGTAHSLQQLSPSAAVRRAARAPERGVMTLLATMATAWQWPRSFRRLGGPAACACGTAEATTAWRRRSAQCSDDGSDAAGDDGRGVALATTFSSTRLAIAA